MVDTQTKTKIDFEMSKDLQKIFIENKVNILAIGTGKTHSCGKISVEKIYKDTDDILIISTMSNALINGIIKEICKCLRLYSKFEDLELISEIEKFKDNNSNLLKQLGIVILNTNNPMKSSDLENAKVIITNHAYFFPHGHDNNYNNNCYKIQKYLKEKDKNLICIFDEFDQFHKMGLESITTNFFIGKNFVDPMRNQIYMSDHAFRYCHKSYVERSHKDCAEDDFANDYYYRLPAESFSKKLENNSEGIKYFSNSIGGKYDFKALILNNLEEITGKEISYCNKFGKKVGQYNIKRFDEIVRCKINTDLFQDEGITSKFLKINESIILITQKLEVEDIEGNIWKLDTRDEVIEFAKNNLTKKEWINYYNTFSSEGKKLYITRMIVRKKQFDFNNSRNYYVTATAGILQKLGYELKTDNEFNTPCQIKEMDLFIIPNKSNCHTDMELFFKQLKDKDIQTIAIANKKDIVEEFSEINKLNNEFNNVNPVISDIIIDTGREASHEERDNKNVTYVYQKGNQTQGTNYNKHVLLLQDCHIKVDVVERIIPVGNEDIEVVDYFKSMLKSITQSALRTLRGEYNYKSLCLFVNDEDIDLVDSLADYLNKYNIKVNMINVKEAKKLEDRNLVIKSILKHIEDRHNNFNLGEQSEIYSYDNYNLLKDDKRKKYDEIEIINAYCKLRLRFTTDKDIIPILKQMFGISKNGFGNIKKKNIEKIDNMLNSVFD